MDFGSAVKILSGKKSSEQSINETPATSKIITATVVSKSENGSVRVALDGQVFNEDDSQYIELDTVGGLEEGDTVNILLTGNSGYGLTPFAIGSVGSIDRLSERVTIAQEAGDIALATNQHFWTDTSGAHVTDDTSDAWNTEYAKDNHGQLSNPTDNDPWHNILLNSLGILLRRGLLNLTSISKSAIAFYDGTGNSSDNITASFGGNGAIIGKTSGRHVVVGVDGLSVYNSDGSLAPVNSTFDGKNIDGGSISGSKINFSTFEDGVISGSAIDTSTFKNGTISGSVIDTSTFEDGTISGSVIDTSKFEDGTISGSVIDTSKFKNGTIEGSVIRASTLTDIPFAAIDQIETRVASIADTQIGNATIKQAQVENLSSDYAHVQNGVIDNAKIGYADVNDLNAHYAHVQNGVIDNAKIGYADVNGLNANYAHVQNGVIDNAKIGYADVNDLNAHYASIDMANVNNGWITNGVIANAAIKSEMVESISANQLTAGEIDADEITVRNLKASSLTVQTADGYVYVGEKKIPTKEFIDSLKDELQNEIDGAIETFTVNAIPTLSNTPANDWVVSGDAEATKKLRMKHVGDIAYVVNSASAQNGYCYRFAYDTTNQEFKWVLIKDSDVTAALSRLSNAEGKITGLETFESETTSWINETDEGLETIRTNHTNLSGVVDKTVTETKQLWFTKNNTTAPDKPNTTTFPNGVTSTSTAGNAWRVVVPAWNTSYPNYYYCLQYKLADGTYAWSDVVRDIAMGESQATSRNAQSTANANIKSSIQLWFTKVNATAPDKPSGNTPIAVNDPSKTNQWNLAIPTYNSSYPHYFYCYQQQKGDGTYQWSDVVYDRSVTEAQAKAQAALPSNTFTTFQSTTFKNLVDEVDEQSSTITQLSNSVSSIGNILTGNVANPSNWIISAPSGASYTKEAYGTAGVKVTFNSVGGFEWLYSQPISVTSDNKYMVFFDYTVAKAYTSTSGKSGYGLAAYSGSNAPSGSYDDGNARFLGKAEFSKTASGDRVLKGSFTFTATSDSIILGLNGGHIADNQTGLSFTIDNLVVGETLSTTSNTVNSVKQTATDNSAHIGNLTTTLGINADGTQSSTAKYKYNQLDQTLDGTISRVGATETKLETISNPNLTPYFSHKKDDVYNATSNNDGYWVQSSADGSPSYITAWDFEQTTSNGDGWAHLKANNTTNVTLYAHSYIHKDALNLKPSTEYTFLVEWLNVTLSGTITIFVTTEHGGTNNINDDFFITTVCTAITAGSGSKYLTATTRASLQSGSDKRIRTHVHIPVNASVDGYIRISLYEGKYDGPYKPYVDQSVSSRVSQAETSIEQNTTDITLRATKTEAYQLAQPNLTPFYSVPHDDSSYWVLSSALIGTADANGWCDISISSVAETQNLHIRPKRSESIVPGKKYTMLFEYEATSKSGNVKWMYKPNDAVAQIVTDASGIVDLFAEPATYIPMTAKTNALSNNAFTSLCAVVLQLGAGATFVGKIRLSLYEGEYSGPYKSYSGPQLYSTRSELKVTAEGITSTVEGISSYKYCTTTYRYSLANIKVYSAEGYIDNWSVSQDYNLRVGDTVYLKVYDTTRECDVYIKGTIVSMSSATRIRMTSHGYEDVLPVETIKSTINQSSDSVKIQAEHIEIDGTAIFNNTNFQSNLTTKLDSIKVGGTNLLRGTGTGEGWGYTSFDKETRTFTRSTTATGESYIHANSTSYLMYELGTEYVISCWAKSNGQVKNMDIFTYDQNTKNIKSRTCDVTTEWTRFIFPFKYDAWSTASATPTGFFVRFDNNGSKTSGTEAILYVRDVKLERGNKPTDWSPAPEDQIAYVDSVQVGGRNLLLGTSDQWSEWITPTYNADNVTKYFYMAKSDELSTWAKAGQSVACSFEIEFSGVTKSSSGTFLVRSQDAFKSIADSSLRSTGDNVDWNYGAAGRGDNVLYTTTPPADGVRRVENICAFDADHSSRYALVFSIRCNYWASGKYRIRKVKYELGTRITDWTPAPEDAAITTFGTNYKKFKDIASYTGDGSKTGPLVIVTPILPSHMVTVSISGYNYTRGTETIDLNISFYNYTTNFHQYGYVNYGTRSLAPIKLAKVSSSDKRAIIIIGDASTSWSYPKVLVSEVTIGHEDVPDSYASGWEMSVQSSYPTDYIELTDITSYGSNFKSQISAAQSTANANVKRTQRIYYRKAATGAPSVPTAWVTNGSVESSWTKYNAWSTRVPPIADSTTSTTKYLYLYTCEQYETAGGTTPQYTTVLLDDSTTIIDGGTIITGSLSANSINANSGTFAAANIPNLDASKITAGNIAAARIKTNVISAINSLTAGQIDAARIKVSEISIGQSQVTNLTSDLSAKAAQSDLTTEVNQRKATYGTCSTAAGTALKVVTCANFALTKGARIAVKFTTANTTDAPTLNVNSTASDGTPIWVHNAVASSSNPIKWGANATLTFVYDGSAFVLEDKAPTYTVACSTAATTRAKAATVTGALVINGTSVTLRFSTANTYVSNSVQVNFSATGATNVYVDNAVTSTTNTLLWNAGTSLTFVRQGAAWYLTERSDASKTATTYLTDGGSSGLMVHPSNDQNTGVLITDKIDIKTANKIMNRIDTSGMTLYDGTGVADSDIVAKFASNLIELGKNSQDAVMKFCNGKLQLSYYNDTSRSIRYGDIYSEEMMALRSGYTESPASETGTRLGSVTTSLIEESSKVVSKIASYWYNVSSSSNRASISTVASGTDDDNYCYMDVNIGHNGSQLKLMLDSFFVGVDVSNSGPTLELNSSGFAINSSTPIKAVYADTTVVTLSNGQWLQVASASTVASKLGSGASQSNTICIAQNGDFNTYAGVVTGAMGQDGSARAYIYPNRSGAIRINFILIRFA